MPAFRDVHPRGANHAICEARWSCLLKGQHRAPAAQPVWRLWAFPARRLGLRRHGRYPRTTPQPPERRQSEHHAGEAGRLHDMGHDQRRGYREATDRRIETHRQQEGCLKGGARAVVAAREAIEVVIATVDRKAHAERTDLDLYLSTRNSVLELAVGYGARCTEARQRAAGELAHSATPDLPARRAHRCRASHASDRKFQDSLWRCTHNGITA